jgi:2,4-dienoyl-CoA reductase-like NADH-dependent reductase (Old Yellow Enzyme family)
MKIFETTTMNGLTLSNRLIRSATWEGMCDAEGRPTVKLRDCMQALARGGVGLVVTGYTCVSPEGRQNIGAMGIYADEPADDFKQLTDAVHSAGGNIAIQLVHAGGQANTRVSGMPPVAPSAVKVDQYAEIPVELGRAQINNIVEAFATGARRAKSWGFDGIQLHGAHGYLINQFLSPLTNRRTDDYGGVIENRCRFILDVYHGVRREVGPNFPVMIKLNAVDYLDGGLEAGDAVFAACRLDKVGIDAIEVSAGTGASGRWTPVRTRIKHPAQEAYNLDLARRIKSEVICPVMVVGGFRSYEVVEKAIGESGMDYIAMSRPLIREPDLPRRWRDGDRRPAACISCNGCFKPGVKEGGIYCVQEKKIKDKGE